jgi:RES domain
MSLRLGRAARKQLAESIAGATSLHGDFFRSVAFRYFHPDDVVSGEGTRLHGGRFVPPGVRAVYASFEEWSSQAHPPPLLNFVSTETAPHEVASRKSALGGRSQINIGDYPRMTYVLSVATRRNLDLAVPLPAELANVVRMCLRGSGYSVSQELAAIWISAGVDSIVFPSATGGGRNVAVYLENASAGSVAVRNRAEVLAALRRPRAGKRGQ